jgi:L-xylulokinase
MFADILGIPISVAQCGETGALGAAIAAGVGTGLFSDFDSGVAAMTRRGARFSANPAMSGHYTARYEIFGRITDAMLPIWQRLSDMRGD